MRRAARSDGGKLLARFGEKMRTMHDALSTEKSYRHWILAFLRFSRHGDAWRHPSDLGKDEIEAFLIHLATKRHVAAKTQNQAFCAILFLYKHVLGIELPKIDALRAKESRRLPVVLSQNEIKRLIAHVEGGGGLYRLMTELLYGVQYGDRLLFQKCRMSPFFIRSPLIIEVQPSRRLLNVRYTNGEEKGEY